MKQVIVCVFDVAAGAYARPWFTASLGLALRAFSDEAVRQAADNPMFAHPADFQLFHFGEFDDVQGRFTLLESGPVRIAVASDFRSSTL